IALGNYDPPFGSTFQVVTYNSLANPFVTMNLDLGNGTTLVPTYNETYLTLTAPSPIVTNTNDNGAGSLRAAIALVNSDHSDSVDIPDVITFNIANDGINVYNAATNAFTIQLPSALDPITNAVTLDATTEWAVTGFSGVPDV